MTEFKEILEEVAKARGQTKDEVIHDFIGDSTCKKCGQVKFSQCFNNEHGLCDKCRKTTSIVFDPITGKMRALI